MPLAGAAILGWWLLSVSSAYANADQESGWRLYDNGVDFTPVAPEGGAAQELLIQYFSGSTLPVTWSASKIPVQFCTHAANLPSGISQSTFAAAVSDAAAMWNNVEAAVGVKYTGACSGGSTWGDDNDVNEIAFDDARNTVKAPAVGVTKGSWLIYPGRGDFIETDIVIDNLLSVPLACFRSIVAHEMGHALGFGHSDTIGDLMYPSFNSSDVSTCPAFASVAEQTTLAGIYGANKRPSITAPATQQEVSAGSVGQISVSASDPEGDPLTYEWKQLSGTVVSLSAPGPVASFTAPQSAGDTLTFEVSVFDRYLKKSTATVGVVVTSVTSPPTLPPSFASFLPNGGNTAAAIGWKPVAGATSYRLCSTPTGTTNTTCTSQSTSIVDVSWETILGPAGVSTDRKVISSGTRGLTLAACNAFGCSIPGVGPEAGGFRWSAWQMDYDYFAFAFDIPGSDFKFTIAGLTNLSGPPRKFTIYAGTLANPTQKVIQSCGSVSAGQACVWYLGPDETGHASHVVIVSERAGTPTVETRIKVR